MGLELHDKATRGLPLSEAEHEQLEEWYRVRDQEQMRSFGFDQPDPTLIELQEQIDNSLSEIRVLTEQIQTLSSSNETLRKEQQRLIGEQTRLRAFLLHTQD